MKKMSEINKEIDEVFRTSKRFNEDILPSWGETFKGCKDRLRAAGITTYDELVTDDCQLIKSNGDDYSGSRMTHAADKRSRDEFELDCIVGNMQEDLFCLDNPDFKPNEKATRFGTNNDKSITKEPDLIHIPTGLKVEFKISYCKSINPDFSSAIYRHRDGNFRKYMRDGHFIVVYFIYLNQCAVIDKAYFEDPEMGKSKGAVRIIKEHEYDEKTQKYWDIISVWDHIMINYRMLKGGNHYISDKIGYLYKKRG